MDRDFQHEAEQELHHGGSVRAWMQLRIDAIHDRVTAHEVLRQFGVKLRYHGSEHEEQFSCPFHGKDNKPSARVFPARDGKPSGVWCFVCQERWDSIALWRKFTDESLPFRQTLASMERDYGIPVPEAPRMAQDRTAKPNIPEGHQKLLDACEARLRASKQSFEPRAHLTLGVLLDRIRVQMESHALPLPEAEKRLRAILDKIGERVRCHGG